MVRSPLSALKRPGERDTSREKSALPGTQVPVRSSRLRLGQHLAAFQRHFQCIILLAKAQDFGQTQPERHCRPGKENRSLDKNPGSDYNEHRKGADRQTASSLPELDQEKDDRSLLEARRRSFFLAFIIAVRHSPCNLERHIDCSPQKGEQNRNFFKRHGQIPPFRP